MDRQPTPTISSEDEVLAKSALADWVEAAVTFQNLYNDLIELIDKRQVEEPVRPVDDIDHIPGRADKLIALSWTMRGELGKLVLDMTQLDRLNQDNVRQYCDKLIAHTLTLSRLSRLAQIRMQTV